MPSRTQILCLHEGKRGSSIDPIFIHALLKGLNPTWIRPWPGNNVILTKDCGGRKELIETMPRELKACLKMGGSTTLMVWADVDDDMADAEALKAEFWKVAEAAGVSWEEFDQVVFVFAKDRIVNCIDFLQTGQTKESVEGRRIKHGREAAEAARKLAAKCLSGAPIPNLPSSLQWSCRNWRVCVKRMSE